MKTRLLMLFVASAGLSCNAQTTPFAEYTADFTGTSFPTGWQYMWNAPTDWNGTSSADGTTGAFGNPATYAALSWNGTNYTADGDGDSLNGAPANYLRMNAVGGHPGRGSNQAVGIGNNQDRYAIAAYTIQAGDLPLGYGPVILTGTAGVGNVNGGVVVDTHLNGNPHNRIATVGGATTQPLRQVVGNLNVGDTVYVGVGPNVLDGNDTFTFNFQLSLPAVQGSNYVLADFRDDYQDGTMPAHWQYMWNAPSDWDGSSSSDGSTGDISSIGDFELLNSVGGATWRPDTDADSSNGSPARFLQLFATGGHPGRGANDPETGILNPVNSVERYVITAYTVPLDGLYAIGDSLFSTVNAAGNGNNVRVFTTLNPFSPVSDTIFAAGILDGNFDGPVGQLSAGDTIFVAVGANGTDGSDSYEIDFSVLYQVPEPHSFTLLGLGCLALFRIRRHLK